MKQKNGFTLVDCLMAMTIILLGVSAALALSQTARHQLFRFQERHIALEILESVKHLPGTVLDGMPTRHYATDGSPADNGKYSLTVESETSKGLLTRRFVVTYEDVDGQSRRLTFLRHQWGAS